MRRIMLTLKGFLLVYPQLLALLAAEGRDALPDSRQLVKSPRKVDDAVDALVRAQSRAPKGQLPALVNAASWLTRSSSSSCQ